MFLQFLCTETGEDLRNMKERREGLGVRFYSSDLLQSFDLCDLSLAYGER